MEKYIKANALIDDFRDFAEANKGTYREEGFKNAITVVEMQPTADVRENVHAHWEIVYDEDCDGGGKYICGNCRHAFSFGAYFELCRFDYCPKCGADMGVKK